MNFFYILQSEIDGKFYKGSTANLTKRLLDHKMGRVVSTKNRRPLTLLYTEEFDSYDKALAREKHSKTFAGGKEIKKIINDL